ncbi:hypothetical protein LG204_10275 [Methylovorus menthalis]|uniref:hypothetical protein n=1 Tax=Methylovorus menthalis TaxID=1002227 RepID=UPI001E28FA77|nr:hypothetical protein [Methylovorus menthalis]MCB4811700.1 hypothetical protein [Methylovorus menthalis]
MSVWIMDLSALDPDDVPVTLRFADGEYIDADHHYYDLRLQQSVLFINQAFSGAVLQGSRSGYGQAVLVNTDGGLNYLADYAVDGRDLSISLVDDGTITQYVRGTVQKLVFDGTLIRIILRDPQAIIDEVHPLDVYAGDNVLPAGLEGTTNDIKGSKKPKVFGKVRAAAPILVNTSKLIYQVSSLDADIIAVYDRGAALTSGTDYVTLSEMQAVAPASGEYRAFQGYFRVGSAPAGTITCDVDSPAGAGQVFTQIAGERSIAVSVGDMAAADAVGEVGLYVQEDLTTAALLDSIATSIGFYWFFDVAGVIRLIELAAPTTITHVLNDYEDLEFSRSATGAGSNGLPVYQVRILADKVQEVQTDLAGSVPAENVARLASQYREVKFTNAAVKTRHPLSEELVIESCLRHLADAQAVADRLGALLSVRRDRLQVTARVTTRVDIGQGVLVNVKRLLYSPLGRPTVVLGQTYDGKRRRVTLDLWG